MFTAQLKTTYWNESGMHIDTVKALENVKNIREQYESRRDEHSIWETNMHNSIGLSTYFELVKATGN